MSDDEIKRKIKLIRCKLGEFIKIKKDFANVDKGLKDSEMYLNLRIKELDEDFHQIKVIHNEVVSLGDESNEVFEKYSNDNVYETVKSVYFSHSTNLHELLKIVCLSERHDLTFTEFSQGCFQKINMNTTAKTSHDLSLPYVPSNLMPFDGTYDKWPEFKDNFVSYIHENHNLNNFAKLRTLHSLLIGDALKVIQREFENWKSADYDDVWEKLNKRYNHKRSLVYSYFQNLFCQPLIDKETSSNLKTLYDNSYDSLLALKRLGLKTDDWGDIVLYLVHSKLPMKTKELWDEKISSSDALPNFKKFMDFLERRFRVLESLENTRKSSSNNFNFKSNSNSRQTLVTQAPNITKQVPKIKSGSQKHLCKVCNKGVHAIRKCFKFQKMTFQERLNIISTLAYCSNCLSYSHKIGQCTSENRCTCGDKHHTLLHPTENPELNPRNGNPIQNANQNPLIPPSTSDGRFSQNSKNSNMLTTLITDSVPLQSVIFPTAVVKVSDSNGNSVLLRAVIDACSDASYITNNAVKQLNLQAVKSKIQTVGLGDVVTADCKKIVFFQISSRVEPSFSKQMRAYVMDSISSNRPVNNFKNNMSLESSLALADPSYNVNAKIDLLLGGEIDSVIKLNGLIKSQDENICYQETTLGWVVSGSVAQSSCFLSPFQESFHNQGSSMCNCAQETLNNTIKLFWELENIPVESPLTEDEKLCEEIYKETTFRYPSGKYCVSLPFKNRVDGFINMRKIALNRFFFLEKKLAKDSDLKDQYVNCIREYLTLNHMRQVDPNDYPNSYYIPHHSVIKETSTTTRLRVVFDASAKDASLHSLNENILNGPRLQLDLLDLLIQFRFYKVAFTADIEKMYRQIHINPNDEKYQLILWRESTDQILKTFALGTVTFGTTSAPYLAVKTLQRLAEDEKASYPLGSNCLLKGFYVDDCIYGADSLEDALEIQSQTLQILKSAGFHLRKWSANRTELLEAVPESDRETKTVLEFDNKIAVKTLGIQWLPNKDEFHFKVNLVDHTVHTKRSILSDVAKIFDPLGWVAPSVILVKLLIQRLWVENKNWDDPLSEELSSYWQDIRKSLLDLSEIKVPRWLFTTKKSSVEIHGFADASQKAYAAAVYLKSTNGTDTQINLIFSKTKVAPLKTVSLPRLELMAAVMLAKMMDHLRSNLTIHNASYHYWSDSQIALAWICDDPHKRAVFVSHRVTEIQSTSNASQWRYVNTSENPADLGTRGILPSHLVHSKLWWNGPDFLKSFDANAFKMQSDENIELPPEDDIKKKSVKAKSVLHNFLTSRRQNIIEVSSNIMKFGFEKLNKFSTLNKLIRVVAYCLRIKKVNRKSHIHISPLEFENALIVILKLVQNEAYSEEVEALSSGLGVSKNSKIHSLNPFMNSTDKLLRVSGRLGNAIHLNYDQKFPIILPKDHVVSTLIVRHAHLSSVHGTQQDTLILIFQKYHIVKCKSLVKFIIGHCVRCFRMKCALQKQQMGLLPELRITPNRPFLNSGVDFAGPFQIKKFKGRCQTHHKSYFALFICFSTKAVHLEIVIDLSTSAFIAAYRRFIARRGFVRNLHSDCGTNFVGAKKPITRSMKEVENQWNEEIARELAEFQTQWHFNPPGAPHFGGLWEAGVKSVKHHLKRIVGETRYTYDEFETCLLQIESILNSRPLGQISENGETVMLTPAHFLIQDSLLSMPDNNLIDAQISPLDRWTSVQKVVQTFWKIWSSEYLNSLQQRKKWKEISNNLKENDIVLLKDNNVPPNCWPKGIIVKVHPGPDGLVRVVTVKTQSNTFQRPIVKVIPLPILK